MIAVIRVDEMKGLFVAARRDFQQNKEKWAMNLI